jgi:hypothetical protein
MEISIVDEKAFLLPETLTVDQARERAWDKKVVAFGSGLTSIFSRPKAEDVEVTYSEKRYEPFWFIRCVGHHVYDRTVRCPAKATGPEVQSVTVAGQDYLLVDDKKYGPLTFFLPGVEHCKEDQLREAYCDGQSGERQDLSALLQKYPRQEILLDNFAPEGIVVAPEIRASFVVRQMLQEMIKPVQADKIMEEQVIIEKLELYYRPVYAFEFKWIPKERVAVAEFDGLTGQMRTGGRTLRQKMSGKISRDLLFDLGADVLGMVVPGGSIAVKLTKAAIDGTRKDK